MVSVNCWLGCDDGGREFLGGAAGVADHSVFCLIYFIIYSKIEERIRLNYLGPFKNQVEVQAKINKYKIKINKPTAKLHPAQNNSRDIYINQRHPSFWRHRKVRYIIKLCLKIYFRGISKSSNFQFWLLITD